MRRWVRGVVCAAAACALSCSGTIGTPGGSEAGGNTASGNAVAISCFGPAEPAVAPLKRFAVEEYERALRNLVGDGPVDAVQANLAAIPQDAPEQEGGFDRQDTRTSDRHIEGYYRVADGIASTVSTDAALREAVAGSCARDAVDEACLQAFVPSFLRTALRRPPDSEETDRIISTASEFAGNDRVHAVVFMTLMSPDFLYRFENRGELVGSGPRTLQLTPYEVASRLAYHFWSSPPDQALLAAAENGDLDSDEGYQAEVQRVYEDPRTAATLNQFFSEWFHLERGDFVDSPRLDALRGPVEVDGLAAEMRTEVEDLLVYYLEDEGGQWSDVLTSTLSFARTPRLADLYGVSVWDGASTPPELPADERSGLLTRAALLFTGDGSTNPFRRGAFVRRTLLCDPLAPPPANLPADALEPPETVAGTSTRDAFASKVVDQPCAGCHAQFSDLGYVLEAYDGLGQFRTEEQLLTDDGTDQGVVPVEMAGVTRVDFEDTAPVSGPVELSERIAASPKANECLARHYFRFAYRRDEQAGDGCTVGSIAARLEGGESLRQALRSVALEPAFRQLRVAE